MFNFEKAVNVTNAIVQLEDVKVLGGASIKFGINALRKLNLPEKNALIMIFGDVIGIAGTSQLDKADKPVGRKVTIDKINSKSLHEILGGDGAVWKLSEEGQVNPATGDKFYALTKVEQPIIEVEEEDLVRQAESMELEEEAMEGAEEDLKQEYALEQDRYDSIAD